MTRAAIRLITGIAGSRQPGRTRRLRRFVQMTLASREFRYGQNLIAIVTLRNQCAG